MKSYMKFVDTVLKQRNIHNNNNDNIEVDDNFRMPFHMLAISNDIPILTLDNLLKIEDTWSNDQIKCGQNACVKKIDKNNIKRYELKNKYYKMNQNNNNNNNNNNNFNNNNNYNYNNNNFKANGIQNHLNLELQEKEAAMLASKLSIGPKQYDYNLKKCIKITNDDTGICFYKSKIPNTRYVEGDLYKYIPGKIKECNGVRVDDDDHCILDNDLYHSLIEPIKLNQNQRTNTEDIYMVEKTSQLLNGLTLLNLYVMFEKMTYDLYLEKKQSIAELDEPPNIKKQKILELIDTLNHNFKTLIYEWEAEHDMVYCILESGGYNIILDEQHPDNVILNYQDLTSEIYHFLYEQIVQANFQKLTPLYLKSRFLKKRQTNSNLLKIIDFGYSKPSKLSKKCRRILPKKSFKILSMNAKKSQNRKSNKLRKAQRNKKSRMSISNNNNNNNN